MTFETFTEKFGELTFSEKVMIYNDFCSSNNYNGVYDFDEEFFEMAFSNKLDVARAVYFGRIGSWSDEFIRFDDDGNLESLCTQELEEEKNENMEDIFGCYGAWKYNIDDVEEYVCPICGHVFTEDEMEYNDNTLNLVCGDCGWKGNEEDADME